MSGLKTNLKSRLEGAAKIAVLGIGSLLRADDAAGMLVAENIEKHRGKTNGKPEVKVFFGETAPENLTGEIKKFEPTHLIIVDSGDTGKNPGAITVISPEEETGVSFSTHQLPTGIMIDYLLKFIPCRVTVIVIQPKDLNFNHPLSKGAAGAVKALSSTLLELLTPEFLSPLPASRKPQTQRISATTPPTHERPTGNDTDPICTGN
jgi:hydrogenase 3 maturation protease